MTNSADSAFWRALRSAALILHPNSSRTASKSPLFDIECVQTDKGAEFTNSLNNTKTVKTSLFEKHWQNFSSGMDGSKNIPFGIMGKVERSHREDNEYFYATQKLYSLECFRKQLAVRNRKYNNYPMRPLNRRSPKDVLFFIPCSVIRCPSIQKRTRRLRILLHF